MHIVKYRPNAYGTASSTRAYAAELSREDIEKWLECPQVIPCDTSDTRKKGPLDKAKDRADGWSPVRLTKPLRADGNVIDVHALVLDYDDTTEAQIDDLLESAKDRGFEFFWHTSFTHGLRGPRYRLIFPLSEPVPRAEWRTFWPRAVHFVAGDLTKGVDRKCADASHFFYSPSTPLPDTYQWDYVVGDKLTPQEVLEHNETLAMPAKGSKASGAHKTTALASGIFAPGQNHTAALTQAAKQKREGIAPALIVERNVAAAAAVGADDLVDVERASRDIADKASGPLTQLAIAQRLVDRVGSLVKFFGPLDTWYEKEDSGGWKETNAAELKTTLQNLAVAALYDEREKELEYWTEQKADADFINALKKRYTSAKDRVQETAYFEGVFSAFSRQEGILRTELPQLPPHVAIDRTQTIDLRTGECTPHEPDFFFTEQLAEPYDPRARDSAEYLEIKKLMDEWMCGDADRLNFWRDMIGYGLTGETNQQKLFLLTGEGRNGKSLALRLVSEAMGSFAAPLPEDFVQRKWNDVGKHPTDTVGLIGKRFAYDSDIDTKKPIDEHTSKRLTSGEQLSTRALYARRPIKFYPTFKMILATNELPDRYEQTTGAWRRIELLPFNAKFEGLTDDNTLAARLASPIGRQAMVCHLVECARGYYEHGLRIPQESIEAKAEYRAQEDTVQAFADERLRLISPDAAKLTHHGAIYTAYANWAKDSGVHPMREIKFNKELRRVGVAFLKHWDPPTTPREHRRRHAHWAATLVGLDTSTQMQKVMH